MWVFVLPNLGTRDGSPADNRAAARSRRGPGVRVGVGGRPSWSPGRALPILDSLISLAGAAGAHQRVRLGVGRAHRAAAPGGLGGQCKVASIQHLSGDRLLLGVGGGRLIAMRHSWAAAGRSPEKSCGRRTDEALRVPGRISSPVVPVRLDDQPSGRRSTLSPGPRSRRSSSGACPGPRWTRAARYGDGWSCWAPLIRSAGAGCDAGDRGGAGPAGARTHGEPDGGDARGSRPPRPHRDPRIPVRSGRLYGFRPTRPAPQ